ncbi:MAG TPA: hypothetical protein PKD55_11315, partial [Bellilinea sp.]|nr:hypothetical protein [Bellilinea sp.]
MNESYSYDKNIKHTLRKLIDQKKNELKLMRDELNQLSENFLVTDLLPQGLRSTQLSALDMEQEITSKAGKFAGLRKEIDDLENFGKSISAEIEGTYKASLDRL